MTAAAPDHAPRPAPAGEDDDAFAATISEELPDSDDPEALPGAVPVDERPLQTLPTIGHVGRYALKYQLGAGGLGTVHAPTTANLGAKCVAARRRPKLQKTSFGFTTETPHDSIAGVWCRERTRARLRSRFV